MIRRDATPVVGAVAIVVALLLGGAVTRCSVGHCAEPEPDSVGLHAGTPAPYTGVLTPPHAYRTLLRAQDDLAASVEARALDAVQARADIAALEQRLAAVEAARRACEHDRAPAAPRLSWYEEPGWVLAGGVLLGVGATAAIVAVVR